MDQTFNTEWAVWLYEAGAPEVKFVVVYRTESDLDEEGGATGIKRLWVAARGYEGRVMGEFSAVASFDESGDIDKIASYQQVEPPEDGDFDTVENPDMLTESDLQVLSELWAKIAELTTFDETFALDPEISFVAKVPVPEGEDFVASDGWWAVDLLEPIAEKWQLLLKF